MHFRHLMLRNFRAVDVDLSQRVFIVGPNASGKTNLLDAFRFLREIAQPDGSLVRAIGNRGGIEHLRSLHARQESNVRVEVTVALDDDEWGYALELAGTKTKPLHIVEERVVRGGKQVLKRPNDPDKEDPRLLEQTHLEQLSQNPLCQGD
jgi:predicted ATPase